MKGGSRTMKISKEKKKNNKSVLIKWANDRWFQLLTSEMKNKKIVLYRQAAAGSCLLFSTSPVYVGNELNSGRGTRNSSQTRKSRWNYIPKVKHTQPVKTVKTQLSTVYYNSNIHR